ncbi:MAG TPA: hypothetical protein VLK27_08320 [Chthoniobacterales bacterium]|nr:hypothetical protein [Chthoniobacterales bacterium]
MKSDAQKTASSARTSLAYEIEKAEFVAVIRHALDLRYRRVCQVARADWKRLFGSDPADACVTVRVQTASTTATRGSGFLKSRRQPASKAHANGSVPHFAH